MTSLSQTSPQPRPTRVAGWLGAAVGLCALAVTGVGWHRSERAADPSIEPAHSGGVELPIPTRFVRTFDVSTFQKGNIHAHSRRSDGDSPPEVVYAWYRSHGYQFLILTDHHTVTQPSAFAFAEQPSFVIMGGEEVTLRGGGKQVHLNGLCIRNDIRRKEFHSQREALDWGVEQITAQHGIALINHPNFLWALSVRDVVETKGASLIEIASGHPNVPSGGDRGHSSHEAMWDEALTQGAEVMGVAVDDTHHLGPVRRGKKPARPGRGWVNVFSSTLDKDSVCEALRNGQLYASTGPVLRRISVGETTYSVWPDGEQGEVTFIGSGGRQLGRVEVKEAGQEVRYELFGSEGYVRARYRTPDGKSAWTPAVRTEPVTGDGYSGR